MGRHKSKPNPSRIIKLADQIQKDLAVLIQREFDMNRVGMITLTGVDLTVDYAHAKVYFTVLGAEPEVAAAALNEKAGWLHSMLFKLLHIHTVPTLRFIHDEQLARGIALTHLIEQVNRPSASTASADTTSASPAPEDPDEQP